MTGTATATAPVALPAVAAPDEQMRRLVAEIRGTGWVSPRLTGYLGVRDTSALEAVAHRQIAELGRVDALLAQVVAPLSAPIAQLVPDQSAQSLPAGLQQMSAATGRAEQRLYQVQRQVPQRWVAGAASEAMTTKVADLRAQMSAGSAATEAVGAAVDGATRVVTSARTLVLTTIVQGTGRALAWVQQYGRVLIAHGGLAEVIRQVGAVVQQVMQQIRAVVADLTGSQQSLAGIVKRLSAALAVLGTAGGAVLIAGGGGKTPKAGRIFVNAPHADGSGSTNVMVPDNHVPVNSRTGDGINYKHPRHQGSVRIMPTGDAHGRYPAGRTIITGPNGDKLGPDGKTGGPEHTHHAHGNTNGLDPNILRTLNSAHPLLLLPGQQQWLNDRACESKRTPGCPGTVEQ